MKGLVPRMKLADGTFQILPVKVGINFGSGDTFMPQHLLHGAEIGPSLYQVCGERMPESMRTYCFFEPGKLNQAFDH